MPLCFRRCSIAILRTLAAHRELLTRSSESAVTGFGSEIVIRLPQTEQ